MILLIRMPVPRPDVSISPYLGCSKIFARRSQTAPPPPPHPPDLIAPPRASARSRVGPQRTPVHSVRLQPAPAKQAAPLGTAQVSMSPSLVVALLTSSPTLAASRLYCIYHTRVSLQVGLSMKFGKRLASEASRRWRPFYLDYKTVKRAIQHDVRARGQSSDNISGPHQTHRTKSDNMAFLQTLLDANLLQLCSKSCRELMRSTNSRSNG